MDRVGFPESAMTRLTTGAADVLSEWQALVELWERAMSGSGL